MTQTCRQNNIFDKRDASRNDSFYLFMASGSGNAWERVTEVPGVIAGNIVCGAQLRMTEKDNAGTMHVRASIGGWWSDWTGQHTFNKTMEFNLAPNQTKTISGTANSWGGDTSSATITVTNQVL